VILDLYNILKVKSGIIEKKERVKFSELVDDIRHSLDTQIKKDHIEFTVDFSEADEINTLKSYLYSILYNLISNSIKYRNTNDICSIEIRTHKHASGITLRIKDNGIGMNFNKMKNNLFGLYKRFHPGIEGRGVGLFMVKTQVEALGGTITAESEPDVGTEFTIDFKSTADL
jgi:signal transduction histidine kinase